MTSLLGNHHWISDGSSSSTPWWHRTTDTTQCFDSSEFSHPSGLQAGNANYLVHYVTRKTHICLNVLRMEFPYQALLLCVWSQMVVPKPTWCLLDSTIHLADTADVYPIVLGSAIVAVWHFPTNSRISLETRSISPVVELATSKEQRSPIPRPWIR